jgi:hypothetical protein
MISDCGGRGQERLRCVSTLGCNSKLRFPMKPHQLTDPEPLVALTRRGNATRFGTTELNNDLLLSRLVDGVDEKRVTGPGKSRPSEDDGVGNRLQSDSAAAHARCRSTPCWDRRSRAAPTRPRSLRFLRRTIRLNLATPAGRMTHFGCGGRVATCTAFRSAPVSARATRPIQPATCIPAARLRAGGWPSGRRRRS